MKDMRAHVSSIAVVISLAALSGCVYYQQLDQPADGAGPSDARPQLPVDAGADANCAMNGVCDPGGGKVGLAGQIVLADTRQPLLDAAADVKVILYDALAFAQNPTTATPIGETTIDDQGVIAPVVFPAPATGYVAISLEPQNGDWVRTAVFEPAQSGLAITDLTLVAVSTALDQQWSSSAGIAGSFAQTGAILFRFTVGGNPRTGVVPTSNGTAISAVNAFYFTGNLAQTIDPVLEQTGASGSVLAINTPLVNHSGQGGEPTGCGWESRLAAAIPGVISQFDVPAFCP